MLHPDTYVRWLDFKSSDHHKDCISKLFQSYCEHQKPWTVPNSRIIEFEDDMAVKDGYGWTALQSIIKITDVDPSTWIRLDASNHMICMTDGQYVPIFNNAERIGFHGSRLNRYTLTRASNIMSLNKIRAIDVHSVEMGLVPCIISVDLGPTETTGYILTTRSGFVTINQLHISCYDVLTYGDTKSEGWN